MCTTQIAHIRFDENGDSVIQSVSDHCRNTADHAQRCLASAGLSHAAYLAGLHHDDGKRTEAFQEYITAASEGKTVSRGSVVHSFTGARLMLELFHASSNNPYEKITAELAAYAIGAHHGLFDCIDEAGKSGFRRRLTRTDVGYEEAVGNLWEETSNRETEELFHKAVAEISNVIFKLQPILNREQPSEMSFYFGLLARLLTSGVIEGDRRDTAEFMNACSAVSPHPDWTARLQYMERRLRQFSSDTPLQQARQEISDRCRAAAEKPCGIFRLNVPTGAGKTLSSLRFALAHAAKWQKSRIIFTTPLLSILEQNAAVLREFIGDENMVLEHHSNAIREKPQNDELDRGELLAESWSAPVIITTLVQLLNTLFSGNTQSIRRFQALSNSIIVIDEVQTVPAKMLSLFNLALNFLSVVCNTTIVLCSATQPCLEETGHGIRVSPDDIVPRDESLWMPFRRTALMDAGTRKLDEIPVLARDVLTQVDSLLIICNKKDEARQLSLALADLNCFHLSASMCPAHRREVLSQIQEHLGKGKVVCVSTQVMEAGVDISFGCVIRLTAGMDSIIQAAGRCNRNGECISPLPVYLLDCAGENLARLPEIQNAKTATIALLDRFRRDPDRYGGDLTSDQAIRDYYRKLYEEMPAEYQDYSTGRGQPTLYELLSLNLPYWKGADNGFVLQQAFRTAGGLFQVFDADTTSVLVPYGKGRELIDRLSSPQAWSNLSYMQSLLEQAKPYLVNIYQYQFEALERAQGLGCDPGGHIYWLEDGLYDEAVGLITERKENPFLEV